jgi:hypothetical protein
MPCRTLLVGPGVRGNAGAKTLYNFVLLAQYDFDRRGHLLPEGMLASEPA